MICFYHRADLDGHCAGAIVRYMHERMRKNDLDAEEAQLEMIGIDYGDPFPWDKVQGQTVIMVDFSLQPFSDMYRLWSLAAGFIWIDHHRTALQSVDEGKGVQFAGLQREGIGACQLAWEHFFGAADIPEAVRLLAEYDVWDKSDQNCEPFQSGMKSLRTDPKNDITMKQLWEPLLSGEISDDLEYSNTLETIVADGHVLLRNSRKWREIFAKENAFLLEWDGYVFLAANGSGNSQYFDSLVADPLTPEHDGLMLFSFRPGTGWKVSLYCDQDQQEPLNCGALAKKHGGGGHPGAAGFHCDELPFDLHTAMNLTRIGGAA